MTTNDSAHSVYSVMTCSGVHPATMVSLKSEWNGHPWMTGARIKRKVPEPLLYELNPRYPGQMLAFYRTTIPLMRSDLLAALTTAGVDNLDLYRAIVHDPTAGKDHLDYSAVNVIGTVNCADMNRSEALKDDDDEGVFVFDSLYIDDARAGGALMFRLGEAPNALVVHQRVRQAVEGKIPGMTFAGPGEWSG